MKGDLITERITVNGYRGSGGAVTVPEGMRYIHAEAFRGQEAITSVHLPDTITAIGESAFRRCTSLTDVNIPAGVALLPKDCFRSCRALTHVTLSDGLREIRDTAFYGCHALETLTIPATVEMIGEFAFARCLSLRTLTFSAPVQEIRSGAFSDSDPRLTIALGGVAVPFRCLQEDMRVERNVCRALRVLSGKFTQSLYEVTTLTFAVCLMEMDRQAPTDAGAQRALLYYGGVIARMFIRHGETAYLCALLPSRDRVPDKVLPALAEEASQCGEKEAYIHIVDEMRRRGLLEDTARRL